MIMSFISVQSVRRHASSLLALGLSFTAALALVGTGAAPSIAQPASSATVPASFDCAKATRPVDRFLCANAALRWQALALSRSFRAAQARSEERRVGHAAGHTGGCRWGAYAYKKKLKHRMVEIERIN